ncbi:MAG: hypothetical protein LAT63_00590 [Marinobacter sp.]|nr:hypothetical protein [Marinobacter sp.]
MTRNPALALPTGHPRVSGFALAVLALLFLCAITQSNTYTSVPGKVSANHLEHLVVASHSTSLSVADAAPHSDNTHGDAPDKLARLRSAIAWLYSRPQVPSVGVDTASSGKLPDYLTPPLRAPPIA